MKDKLLQIINYYGINKQLKYIHSEYFELDEAIIVNQWARDILTDEEYEDYKKDGIKHIAEEIADIMVMLKQIQYYYDIKEEKIMEIMESKIDRQLERINSENKSR